MRACGGAVLVAAALLGIWIWSSPSDSPQLHVRHAASEFLARRAIVSAAERAAGGAATGAFTPRPPTMAEAARPAERAAAAVASSLRAAVAMGSGTDLAESPPLPAQRRSSPPPPATTTRSEG